VFAQSSAHTKAGSGAYFAAMANAWFGWCPHGDQRWNLRFLELLTAGAVPVVVADGLLLPFDQVERDYRFVVPMARLLLFIRTAPPVRVHSAANDS
jgi:hypothetical protein